MGKWLAGLCLLWCLQGANGAVPAADADADPQPLPAIAIIIDDLGGRLDAGRRAVELPGPVACAFLPHTAHTRQLAMLAHSHNKEVMLHLPMQTVEARPLDAGGLRLDMTHREFVQALQQDLAAVPHVTGINNHMGSLLTRHPGHMLWLMQEINRHGKLFFVDSRTTAATVALQVAMENDVPSLKRDVFLDNDPAPGAVRAQFLYLVRRAKQDGNAVAIGHPHPGTLKVLEQMLPTLAQHGVRLVSVAEMIQLRQAENASWHVSSYHSPKAAKNSKP